MNLEQRIKILEYKLCLMQTCDCIDIVTNYQDIIMSGKKKFIFVVQDETNNNDSSLYLYTGIELKLLLTSL